MTDDNDGDNLEGELDARRAWVFGRDAAIQFGGPDELLFPMTMIS